MKISVQVKANSTKGPLVKEVEGGLLVYVRELAVEGRANEAVVGLLAQYFKVAKSQVRLVRGGRSRVKVFEVLE